MEFYTEKMGLVSISQESKDETLNDIPLRFRVVSQEVEGLAFRRDRAGIGRRDDGIAIAGFIGPALLEVLFRDKSRYRRYIRR